MEAILSSFFLVFVGEIGDKTQLLALVLATKFRKPLPIVGGIFVATILNHALASYAGAYVTSYIPTQILKWILGGLFIVFGLWILIPDKQDSFENDNKWGPFFTTLVAFFLAEMGDKTQLATVALAAKYTAPVAVTLGTTLGMMGANIPAVFFGDRFSDKIPMSVIHKIASALFIVFGLGIIIGF